MFRVGIGVPLSGNGLNKRRRYGDGILPLGEKKTKTSLLDPGPGVLKCRCPMSVLAHPFGARCFQLLCCQRKTSLPSWRCSKKHRYCVPFWPSSNADAPVGRTDSTAAHGDALSLYCFCAGLPSLLRG